jgi:hypothetical protein
MPESDTPEFFASIAASEKFLIIDVLGFVIIVNLIVPCLPHRYCGH